MIEIKNLKKKYSADFTLNIENLKIKTGERVALIGANGSGKSTLLKLISGYIKPDSGEILINTEKMAYLPQDPYIFSMSVRKNVRIGLKDNKKQEENLKEILIMTGLFNLLDKNAAKLSGGEKQRMVFARMLIDKHNLLMLDEPFGAIDIDFKDSLEQILSDYCIANKTTLIMATHTPAEAFNLCDKLIIMHKGEVIEYGQCGDIIKNPKTDFGKTFLKQWRITDV
ncbi:MAG: ATP-binding cassette domain-containing protein [Clostridiales bacterium]|jgi:ABC-type Fe3+/spermidine/putrescine transport system ATPase subunit|nr:ATP-binding cassette domain-containing protein [Clostridiales bacterium]